MRHIASFFTLFLVSFASIAANYPAKKTVIKPIIDGNQSDACWTTADWAPIDQLWVGTAASNSYSGRFKVAWDDSLVYILVEIMDDIFHDTHPNPLIDYYNDDCIEIFVDENKSGGDHEYNFNAFAYHVSIFGDVVDNNKTGPALFNNNLKMDLDTIINSNTWGNTYTWEVALKIYNDKYDESNPNLSRVWLAAEKKMGFSMAYNDSDSKNTRERMYGSQVINGSDKNISYKTADAFGSLELLNNTITSISDEHAAESGNMFFNPEKKHLILNQKNSTQLLVIRSLDGKEMKLFNSDQINNQIIDLEFLPPGFYLIQKLDVEGNLSRLKIIIQ